MFLIIFFFLNFSQAQTNTTPLDPLDVEAINIEAFSDRTGIVPSTSILYNSLLSSQSPFDALTKVPGIQTKDESGPSISIRGSVSNNRVLSLVNDIPINFDIQGPSLLLLPYEVLEDLHIFKGPASNFYGDFAMGGAINFKIKKLKNRALSIGAGSFQSRHFLYTYKTKSNSQFHLFHKAAIDDFPYKSGPNYISGNRDNNEKELYRASYLSEKKTNNTQHNFLFLAASKNSVSPGPANFLSKTKNKEQGGLSQYSLKKYWKNSTLGFQLYLATQTNQFMDSSYPQSRYAYINSGSKLNYEQDLGNYQTNINFIYKHYEYDFNYDFGTAKSNNYKKDAYEISKIISINWGDFIIQPSFKYIVEHQKIASGLQILKEYSKYYWQTSYTQGFRNPGYGDKYVDTSNFVSNSKLNPETSYQVEFKVGRIRNSFINWSISAFFLEYKNLIKNINLSGGSETKKNIGYAQSKGFEIDFSKNFQLIEFSYLASYQESVEQSGVPLNLSPYFQSKFHISHYWGPLKIDLANVHWSDFYDKDFGKEQQKMHGWTSWDFSISSYAFKSFSFRLIFENFTNQSQVTKINYPQAGRNYYLEVQRFF